MKTKNVAYVIGVIFFLLGMIVGMFIFMFTATSRVEIGLQPEPVPSTTTVQSYSPGQQFILHKNESAKIVDAAHTMSVKIIGFANSPCPAVAECFWQGQGVNLEIISSGGLTQSGMNMSEAFGYHISIDSTDYQTYAKLTIINSNSFYGK